METILILVVIGLMLSHHKFERTTIRRIRRFIMCALFFSLLLKTNVFLAVLFGFVMTYEYIGS